jgi:hypothetical protein
VEAAIGGTWAVVFGKNLLSAGRRFAFIPGPLIESGLVGCGGIPKWPTGADCKSAGYAFTGSNPVPTTTLDAAVRIIPDRGVFVGGKPAAGFPAEDAEYAEGKGRPRRARKGKAGKGQAVRGKERLRQGKLRREPKNRETRRYPRPFPVFVCSRLASAALGVWR